MKDLTRCRDWLSCTFLATEAEPEYPDAREQAIIKEGGEAAKRSTRTHHDGGGQLLGLRLSVRDTDQVTEGHAVQRVALGAHVAGHVVAASDTAHTHTHETRIQRANTLVRITSSCRVSVLPTCVRH